MSRIGLWIVILGGMAVTYGIRLSFIAFLPSERLPTVVRRGLRYVPPAVLAAIILAELARPSGSLDISLGNVRLLAGIVAGVVAWRSHNIWLTILTGLGALWALSVLLS